MVPCHDFLTYFWATFLKGPVLSALPLPSFTTPSPTSKTRMPSKRIWTPYNGGSQTGSCTSIHKNTKPCTSPTNVTSSNPPTHPQSPNNQHSQITRYPHPQHLRREHSHQQDCAESKHNFSLPPQKHSHIICPRKPKHLAYTTLVGLRPILEYASII